MQAPANLLQKVLVVLSEMNFSHVHTQMLFEIPDLNLFCLDLELLKMLTLNSLVLLAYGETWSQLRK